MGNLDFQNTSLNLSRCANCKNDCARCVLDLEPVVQKEDQITKPPAPSRSPLIQALLLVRFALPFAAGGLTFALMEPGPTGAVATLFATILGLLAAVALGELGSRE